MEFANSEGTLEASPYAWENADQSGESNSSITHQLVARQCFFETVRIVPSAKTSVKSRLYQTPWGKTGVESCGRQ